MELFEIATKEKFRFKHKGYIDVEDLWDLGQEELDSIYKDLSSQLRQYTEESLLIKNTSHKTKTLERKQKIVQHIFTFQAERKRAEEAKKDRADKKQKILAIISKKQDEGLESLSVDELTKMVDEL